MLGQGSALTEKEIEEVLAQGSSIYGQVTKKTGKGAADHLMPQEVMDHWPPMSESMVFLGFLQKEVNSDQFEFVKDLETWMRRTGEPIAACLTMRSVTIAVCFSADGGIFLFDSHSEHYIDGKSSGASSFVFRDAQQLQRFLQQRFPEIEGVEYYMMNLCEINAFTSLSATTLEPCQKLAAELFGATAKFAGTIDHETAQEPASDEESFLQHVKENIATVQDFVEQISESKGDQSFNLEHQTLLQGLSQLVFPNQEILEETTLEKQSSPTDDHWTFSECHRQGVKFVNLLLQNPTLAELEPVSQLKQALEEQGRLVQKLEAKDRRASSPVSRQLIAEQGGLLQPDIAGPSDASTVTCRAEGADTGPFVCSICKTGKQAEDKFIIRMCGHKLCRDCARQAVTDDINDRNLPLVCPLCISCPCEKCPSKTNKVKYQRNPREGLCAFQDSDLEIVLLPEDMRLYQILQVAYVLKGEGEKYLHCGYCGWSDRFPAKENPGRCYPCPRCKHISLIDILDKGLAARIKPVRPQLSKYGQTWSPRATTKHTRNGGGPLAEGAEGCNATDVAKFAWDSEHVLQDKPQSSKVLRLSQGTTLNRSISLNSGNAGHSASASGGAGHQSARTSANGHLRAVRKTTESQSQVVVPQVPRPVSSTPRRCQSSTGTSHGHLSEAPHGRENAQASTSSETLAQVKTHLENAHFRDVDPLSHRGAMSPTSQRRKREETQRSQSQATAKGAKKSSAGKSQMRKAIEALNSQSHIHLPKDYTGAPSIVCRQCSNQLVSYSAVPKMQIKALIHFGDNCGRTTDAGFGFLPESANTESIDARGGTLVCTSCSRRVGTVGEYRKAEIVCSKCEQAVEQPSDGLDIVNGELQSLPTAQFQLFCFRGESIDVAIGA
ncbi:unnamed protein product [Ostreobium quekettii]|uniref:RING-type domain-containing protein n=1 Tax=Ostreobium quekettii TaxID=121088 RepID=A0A8S1JDJ5_9CHLO|nr:unnamed protein product [Ostreobium quekettii]